jgi:hypothetical protein
MFNVSLEKPSHALTKTTVEEQISRYEQSLLENKENCGKTAALHC